jgi:hypothetical protein
MGVMSPASGRETETILARGSSSNTRADSGRRNDADDDAAAAATSSSGPGGILTYRYPCHSSADGLLLIESVAGVAYMDWNREIGREVGREGGGARLPNLGCPFCIASWIADLIWVCFNGKAGFRRSQVASRARDRVDCLPRWLAVFVAALGASFVWRFYRVHTNKI